MWNQRCLEPLTLLAVVAEGTLTARPRFCMGEKTIVGVRWRPELRSGAMTESPHWRETLKIRDIEH